MDTVVEARSLAKRYEDFSLRDISLEVRCGSIAGIFGPNAAGKSTLLRMLAGLAPLHTGSLRLFGLSYDGAEQELKNRVGYVPQEPVYYADRTVQWIARFVAPYFARWDGAGFYALLDEFKVNPLKKVTHLSGGQRKMLSLAVAVSHGADLLILDEPTAGLDLVHRHALLDRLRAFVAGGERTVIVASHITDGLDAIAEEIWFLDGGRVVMHQDKDDLLARWKRVHYREGALPQAIEERLVQVKRQPFGSSGLTGDYPALRDALSGPLARGDAKLERASLEDILLTIVKGA
jgi:ABC-2 type transport system ATP-binding protein